MKGTHAQLESLGQEISEQDFKTQIILSLPLSWEQYAKSSFAPDGKVNNVATISLPTSSSCTFKMSTNDVKVGEMLKEK
jgi:hypothetical protein